MPASAATASTTSTSQSGVRLRVDADAQRGPVVAADLVGQALAGVGVQVDDGDVTVPLQHRSTVSARAVAYGRK
jgi:hypothetical protein